MGPLITSHRYAAVTSTLALVVALGGGTAYAAALITSKDIKDGAVRRVDLAKNAVDSRKVADGTLLSADFRSGQLPAGPAGPAGPQGPAGPRGPAGAAGTAGPLDLLYVRTGPLSAVAGVTEVYLFCPEDLAAVGGGLASTGSGTTLGMHGSFPFDDGMIAGADSDSIPDDGWAVEVNNDAATGTVFAAYAVCGSATTIDQEFVIVSRDEVSTERTSHGVRMLARPTSQE